MGCASLLVFCVAFAVLNFKLGQTQTDADRIAAVVNEALRSFLNDVQEDINCIKVIWQTSQWWLMKLFKI
ncbi:hypothetical protein GBAR_LOCUS5632 [Geodia barretti]|uniref:Uncharacterized protein n=1 Tax=Geodia barretti TaxID=519541 RepID=A0AA35W4U5_GEOBA|nr:hypothetical protein GBAR_LOCUS5632 [Geodia barretti]